MPSIKLTHTALKAKRAPGYYSIENHPGLYLRVTQSGQRTWVFRSKAGGKASWLRLSIVLDPVTGEGWGHERATAEAARLRADADRRRASGADVVNPIEAVRAEDESRRATEARNKLLTVARQRQKEQEEALRPTLDQMAARYIGVFVAEKRREGGATKRWKDYEQAVYDREIGPRLGAFKVGDIKTKDVAAMRNEIKSESGKRKAVAVLRALLSHAKSDGLIDLNPAIGVKVTPSGRRARVLNSDECNAIWFATAVQGEKDPEDKTAVAGVRPEMLAAVKVQLATGQRAGEVLSMRWSDIKGDDRGHTWTVPAAVAKNGQEHLVPLAPQVWELIEARRPAPGADPATQSPYVFPAWAKKTREKPVSTSNYSHAINRVREELGLDHFTSHDLRRTCATRMAGAKVLPHVIEAVLNHVGGVISGVARVYNRETYLEEKRDALRKWGRQLDRKGSTQGSDVVIGFRNKART